MTAVVCMAAAVGAVPVVHEHVHQRAREEQKQGQRADEVRAMLAEQEVCCDGAHHK
jgi:hypothetical protein